MTRLYVIGLSLAVLLPTLAIAQNNMDWAYPVTPKPELLDSVHQKQAPGSARKYTQAQIDDPFNPPDWYPDQHAPAPSAVIKGTPPAGNACAQCHLMSGNGHPESSDLAGLPAPYVVRQMAASRTANAKASAPPT